MRSDQDFLLYPYPGIGGFARLPGLRTSDGSRPPRGQGKPP